MKMYRIIGNEGKVTIPCTLRTCVGCDANDEDFVLDGVPVSLIRYTDPGNRLILKGTEGEWFHSVPYSVFT